MIIVLIDRPGKDELLKLHLITRLAKIGVESHLDFRVQKHLLEHWCVAILWQRLKSFRQIAVIPIGADWDASADTWVEIFRVAVLLVGRNCMKCFSRITRANPLDPVN